MIAEPCYVLEIRTLLQYSGSNKTAFSEYLRRLNNV